MHVGTDETAGRARQVGGVEPGVASHAGLKQDQVGAEAAALGRHPVGLEALHLVAEVGRDVAPRHFVEQTGHGTRTEAVAGFVGRAEEHHFEMPAPAFAPKLAVDAEQELEHRSAAHRRRFLRVAGESDRDRATRHRPQPITDLFACGNALARCDRVFDARQLPNEAPATGDQDRVVGEFAVVGQHPAAAVGEAGDVGLMEADVHASQEGVERHHQVLPPTQPGGNPDDAGQVVERLARRDQRDVDVAVVLADLANRGETGEAGTDDDDVGHGVPRVEGLG